MKELIEKLISHREIINLLTFKETSENEIIFDEGDDSHSLFILQNGDVVIEKAVNLEKTEFKELAYISSPSFFGEIALFDDVKRTARARAISKCTLIEITQDGFKRILKIDPDLAAEILSFISKTLTLRLAHTSKELTLLYDISKHLVVRYTQEKEFLEKIVDEITLYFNECEIEAYYYNFFNDEFEKIYEINPHKNLDVNIGSYKNSQWINTKTYLQIISDEKQTKSAILYIFEKDLSTQDINDYTTIFNTISYIVSAGMKVASRNNEILLIEKLKRRKEGI